MSENPSTVEACLQQFWMKWLSHLPDSVYDELWNCAFLARGHIKTDCGCTFELYKDRNALLRSAKAVLAHLRESSNWSTHPEVGNSRLRLIDEIESTLRRHGHIQ